MSEWENNQIQFARLIAAMVSSGLHKTDAVKKYLTKEMDITDQELDELFERGHDAWNDYESRL